MTTTTTTDRDFDVQVLEETVRGVFAGKNALIGSQLASSGAIIVNSQMPHGPDMIGNEITMPYFGVLGEFTDNPEDTAAVPQVLKMGNEKATVARSSLAFEVSRWARYSGPDDPYEECSNQIKVSGTRRMDQLAVTAAAATPLVRDLYNASIPVYLDWDLVVDGKAMWGDEQDEIVAMCVHSRVEAGLRKLKDTEGRPFFVDMVNGPSKVSMFNGVPLVISDRLPLDSSSMGTVTEAGASVGGVGLTGTPAGAWDLRIDIMTGGARGTATFKFSTDGGNIWSEELTTAATVPLIDTTADSLVGNNGATGLTATFATATYDAASVYSSTALLKATSLILQRGALAFWYAAAHMGLETDKDILKHNDVAAMHMYHATRLYRRRRGGTKPGVVALKSNVPGYVG